MKRSGWRLGVSALMTMVLALTGLVSATPSAAFGATSAVGPTPPPVQQPMTLAQRRAQVAADQAGAAEPGPAQEPRLATDPGPKPAMGLAADPKPWADVMWLWTTDAANRQIALFDFQHIGDGCCAAAGDSVLVTALIYNQSAAMKDLRFTAAVSWEVTDCDGKLTPYDFGQRVQTWNWNNVFGERKVQPVSLKVKLPPCPPRQGGGAAWRVKAKAVLVDVPDQANPAPGSNRIFDIAQIPPDQLWGCVCALDMAGSEQPQQLRGDPVNTATGSFVESITDARLPAPGVPLTLTRAYSSDNTVAGPLGPGWTLPFLASLRVATNGDVTATTETVRATR